MLQPSKLMLMLLVLLPLAGPAQAQDVPGIENCMAEKQIERRTSCLQSNVNFLKNALSIEVGKARADAQAKIDDARKQIAALQLMITGLQDELKRLRSDVDAAKQKSVPAPATPAAPAK